MTGCNKPTLLNVANETKPKSISLNEIYDMLLIYKVFLFMHNIVSLGINHACLQVNLFLILDEF